MNDLGTVMYSVASAGVSALVVLKEKGYSLPDFHFTDDFWFLFLCGFVAAILFRFVGVFVKLLKACFLKRKKSRELGGAEENVFHRDL